MAILLENTYPNILQEGLNTNKATALGSTLAVTGAVTMASTLAVTGTTTLTGAVSLPAGGNVGVINYANQVTNTGGAYATPIVLTTAQSGRVLLVNDAAGLDFTLPAIATADIGTRFSFVVTTTITSNNFRVTAAAGDLLNGAVWLTDFDTANTGSYFAANGSSNLIVTCNGSTTGGKKGTWLDFIAITATGWWVQGNMFGDGTLATPFSG